MFALCSLAGYLFDYFGTGMTVGIVFGLLAAIIEHCKDLPPIEKPEPINRSQYYHLRPNVPLAIFPDGSVVEGEIIYDRHAA